LKCIGILEPLFGFFGDGHQDDVIQIQRDPGNDLNGRHRLLLQMRRHDRIIAVTHKRPPSGHHFIQRHAERI
jgi:hypothetical protein